jgi:tartrate-resistant acid phosphatase type 5
LYHRVFLLWLGVLLLAGCGLQGTSLDSTAQPLLPSAQTALSQPSPFPSSTDTPAPLLADTPLPTFTPLPTPTETPEPAVRFAVIGDYGGGGQPEENVANLVKSWEPDFIITVGDNNYPDGESTTIDQNIGRFFHEYIDPYQGEYGPGATTNLFFPTLGNHDWNSSTGSKPYLDYFTLPGNERYYNFTWGPVEFFALDSDYREPDGVGSSSDQAAWLKARLAASNATWKLVYMHHPPYSSGLHGPVTWMRWPFKEWGASAVLSGHDHTYERLQVDGLTYFVNGLGGGSIYPFETIENGSQVRFDASYGAMLVEASQSSLNFQFITTQGEFIDEYTMQASK